MVSESRLADLKKAVALADLCQVLSAAFTFPGEDLARALSDEVLASDATACLTEAGAAPADVATVAEALQEFVGADPVRLEGALRKGYSVLYLAPGSRVPVWPYEAAFRHVAEGKTSAPVLFRAPVTLDVEAMMAQAGVQPANNRKEPSDSVWNELNYLSYCYGRAAEALYAEDDAVAEEWQGHASAFIEAHAAKWLPQFFVKTADAALVQPLGKEYAALAVLGDAAFRCIAAL